MSATSPDQGSTPFDLRTGYGAGRLRGMYRLADPASIPPNQFHLLANARITANGVRERPGLAQVHDSQSAECIQAMYELDDGVSALLELDIDYSADPFLDTRKIGIFDEEAATPYQRVFDPSAYSDTILLYPLDPVEAHPTRQSWETAFWFRGRWLAFGQWTDAASVAHDALLEVNLPAQPGEQVNLSLRAILGAYGSTQLPISSAVRTERDSDGELADFLYIGTSDGRVLRYDGSTVSESMAQIAGAEDFVVRLCVVGGHGILATATPPTGSASTDAFAKYQSEPGGSWAAVTVPTGLDVAGLIAYDDGAYVFSGNDVFKFDPDGLDVGTTINTFTGIPCLPFIHRGALWCVTTDGAGAYTLTRRNADNDWSEDVYTLDGVPYWVLVLSGRVLFGLGGLSLFEVADFTWDCGGNFGDPDFGILTITDVTINGGSGDYSYSWDFWTDMVTQIGTSTDHLPSWDYGAVTGGPFCNGKITLTIHDNVTGQERTLENPAECNCV